MRAQKINRKPVCAVSIAPMVLAVAVATGDAFVAPGDPHLTLTAHQIEQLLRDAPLADHENIRALPLARNAHTAHLLVQVRDREPLHYHADSELTVFLMRGRSEIEINGTRRKVTAGDVIHIPHRAVHAYINHGPEIGVAFVVMSPPPGPHDRVLVPPAAGK